MWAAIVILIQTFVILARMPTHNSMPIIDHAHAIQVSTLRLLTHSFANSTCTLMPMATIFPFLSMLALLKLLPRRRMQSLRSNQSSTLTQMTKRVTFKLTSALISLKSAWLPHAKMLIRIKSNTKSQITGSMLTQAKSRLMRMANQPLKSSSLSSSITPMQALSELNRSLNLSASKLSLVSLPPTSVSTNGISLCTLTEMKLRPSWLMSRSRQPMDANLITSVSLLPIWKLCLKFAKMTLVLQSVLPMSTRSVINSTQKCGSLILRTPNT